MYTLLIKDIIGEDFSAASIPLEKIRGVIIEYPYFATARIAELIAAKKQSLPEFNSLLNESSIYITNRKHVFSLLTGDVERNLSRIASLQNENELLFIQGETINSEEPFYDSTETIQDLNSEVSGRIKKTDVLEFSYAVYSPETLSDKETVKPPDQPCGINVSKMEMIEKFITDGHGSIRADKESSLKGDVSKQSVAESEEFITNTLARIYVQQGLYNKAIFAFEKLSLKYPEKSIYFASQIEEIKKLIKR